MSHEPGRDIDRRIREAYEGNNIYRTATICKRLVESCTDYTDELLRDRIQLVRDYAVPGRLVDLCCATGETLFSLDDVSTNRLGIDFSRPFIAEGAADPRVQDQGGVAFVVADAKALPLADASVATLYSFSSLYAIRNISAVVAEIGRVLRPDGRAILDLGNWFSLNTVSVRAYPEFPPTFRLSVRQMERIVAAGGMVIIDRRCFQILPMWASRPRWLAPLLHPVWKRILSRRVQGKMLDEWISSAPLLWRMAFRHVLVCEKPGSRTAAKGRR